MSGREVRNRCCASWQLSASSISYPCCSRKSRIPNRTPDSSSTTSTLFLDIGISLSWDREPRYHKGSAFGIIAGDQFSSVFLHDALGSGETEARAASSLREEWFKNLRQIFIENTFTGIFNRTLDPLVAGIGDLLNVD